MVNIAQASEALSPNQARVLHPAAEPNARVDPSGMYHCSGESDAILEDDSRFLSVYGHRASPAGDGDPAIKAAS